MNVKLKCLAKIESYRYRVFLNQIAIIDIIYQVHALLSVVGFSPYLFTDAMMFVYHSTGQLDLSIWLTSDNSSNLKCERK